MILFGERAATAPLRNLLRSTVLQGKRPVKTIKNHRQIKIIFSQCKVVFRGSPSAANGPLLSMLHICHYPRVAAFSGVGGLARG
jgi:hypothetical protein